MGVLSKFDYIDNALTRTMLRPRTMKDVLNEIELEINLPAKVSRRCAVADAEAGAHCFHYYLL